MNTSEDGYSYSILQVKRPGPEFEGDEMPSLLPLLEQEMYIDIVERREKRHRRHKDLPTAREMIQYLLEETDEEKAAIKASILRSMGAPDDGNGRYLLVDTTITGHMYRRGIADVHMPAGVGRMGS
jgi:hypothetical protein